jgi:outer membrane protein assembly factor BamB
MKKVVLSATVAAFFTPFVRAGERSTEHAWPQLRGPVTTGVAPHANPPIHWSEDRNVRWKKPVPGHGLSTPIVFGDLLYLQTAIAVEKPGDHTAGLTGSAPKDNQPGDARTEADRPPPQHQAGSEGPPGGEARGADDRPRGEGRGGRGGGGRPSRNPPPTDTYRFALMALDRNTGEVVWEKILREQVPHEASHQDGSLAPASPVSDGEHVIAHFGSRGTYGLTTSGELLWEKDLGDMRTRNGFGEGSSPALHGDTVVINWDHEGDSFIVALDKRTGAEKWRQARDEPTSWSTPLVIQDGGRPLVVVSATNRVRAYDLASGELRWECGGLGANCTPTPVANESNVFAMSGFRDDALLAIAYPGAAGDLTGSSAVVWKINKGTPYVPSPLLYGDLLYLVQKNSGIISCYDAPKGAPHYTQQRLEEITGIYASPAGAADRVYVLGRNGIAYVLRHGPMFEVLAVNKLEDEFSASPAIVGRQLYLRGHKHLYCIAEQTADHR